MRRVVERNLHVELGMLCSEWLVELEFFSSSLTRILDENQPDELLNSTLKDFRMFRYKD